MRRRRRAEPLDRDRLVERVLALATKRSADARRARDALRAFRAALGTRDEANRARMASREPATALLAAARITKRLASGPEDLKAVERLLRAAASVTADGEKKPPTIRETREKPRVAERRTSSSGCFCARRAATPRRRRS